MSKNILIVLAHNNFRDEEFTSIKSELESKGAKITIASTVTQNALGSQGMKVNPDLLIDEVTPEDYDGVIFIGGTGSSQYWHDSKAHEIIKTLSDNNKVIAASSHAPATLAVSGILKNKNATGHVTIYEKLLVAGAKYTGKKVEKDGKIITSTGVNAAKEFAETVAQAI